MNKIYKYIEFLKENQRDYSWEKKFSNVKELRDSREDFIESIENMGVKYNEYYTTLCNKSNLTQKDLDSKYVEMQDFMTNNFNWSVSNIKKLFSKEANDLLDIDFIHLYNKSSISSISGEIDYYLYRTSEILGSDSDFILLGGSGAEDIIEDKEECIIKYKYGQHKNPYGILMFNQSNISIDYFLKMVYKNIYSFLNDNDWYDEIIHKLITNKTIFIPLNFKRYEINSFLVNKLDFENYSINENNKLIINVDDFRIDLNKLLIEFEFEVDNDDIISVLMEYLTDFVENISISDDKEYVVLFDEK